MAEEYTFERQFTRDVHEHEILLSFNDDDGAVLFMDWWRQKGEKAFEAWQEGQA